MLKFQYLRNYNSLSKLKNKILRVIWAVTLFHTLHLIVNKVPYDTKECVYVVNI